jgi:hypothetical protein
MSRCGTVSSTERALQPHVRPGSGVLPRLGHHQRGMDGVYPWSASGSKLSVPPLGGLPALAAGGQATMQGLPFWTPGEAPCLPIGLALL